jgi:hypothetical protein
LALQTFLDGSSISAAAREAGIAFATAHGLLKPVAEASGRQLVTWNQMTADDVEEANELRSAGWSYAALGRRYSVTRQAVTQRLKARRDPGG